jgi:allophanate hydrolase
LSARGVVPACRTLDTISIFALDAQDAARVCRATGGYDLADAYSRPAPAAPAGRVWLHGPFRFGVPDPSQLQFFGNTDYPPLFDAAIARLEALGGLRVPIDFSPFIEAGALLYEGPWVAERYAVIEDLLRRTPEAVYPTTRQIIESGAAPSAVQAFRAQYRLQELRRASEQVWQQIDVLLTPTAATIYRIAEVEAEPLRLNSTLGFYTNFMNLLDLAGVAVPAGFTASGLPFGITLTGPAWSDFELLALAARCRLGPSALQGATRCPLPDEPPFDWSGPQDVVPLAVCGAHLEGLALNHQLLERGAVLLERTRTAARYRFYALPGGPPYRPGLLRVAQDGVAVEVEVWAIPAAALGSFVAGIPAPLGIGKVQLADGREVSGFLCEAHAIAGGALDISHLGGWRAFLANRG